MFEERRLGVAEVRDGAVVHDGTLTSLRNRKDDTVAVGQGHECGMIFGGFTGVIAGDRIEVYALDEVLPELG